MSSKITLKGIIDEDFVNYRVPSMTIMFPYCTFKCGKSLCQNSPLVTMPDITMDTANLCKRYLSNPITRAVVCQGLEPMNSFDELLEFIRLLRNDCQDDVVIYTGYNKHEIPNQISALKEFPNIVIKYGRYYPNQDPHFDDVLGVNLASDNQYAERIS